MLHSSLSSISCCFIFFLFIIIILIPQHKCSPLPLPLPLSRGSLDPDWENFPVSVDLVNTTCELCKNASASFNYKFCVSSLQRLPISHAANFQGLAIVALELAVENASNTVLKIANMMNSGTFDHHDMSCLEDCMETYSHSVASLLNAVGAFMARQYGVANTWKWTCLCSFIAIPLIFRFIQGHASLGTDQRTANERNKLTSIQWGLDT